ncbi:MAG: copper amine oxidase N-terminal domain-containing protein [Armatimonadota bacterium]
MNRHEIVYRLVMHLVLATLIACLGIAVYSGELAPTEINTVVPADYGSVCIPKNAFPKGNGMPIPIYLPRAEAGTNSNIGDWKTELVISGGEVHFSKEKFLSNLAHLQLKQSKDSPGIDTGVAASGSIAAGLLSAFATAFDENRFRVTVQQNQAGGIFRAVIEIFVDEGDAVRKNAGSVISSPDASSSLACAAYSNWLKEKFRLDKTSGYYQGYWFIDQKHKDDQYIAYLALLPKVNAVLVSPKVYPGDKFEIKKVTNPFFGKSVIKLSGEEYVGVWAYKMPLDQAETLKVLELLPFSLNSEVTPPKAAPDGLLTTVYGYAAPSGSTLVPVRGIAEWCGAKVSYDPNTKTIKCESSEASINLTLGSKKALVVSRGATRTVSLTQPASELDGYTLVPLRFVGEAFGCQINYVSSSETNNYPFPIVDIQKGNQAAKIPIYCLAPADMAGLRGSDLSEETLVWPVDVYGGYAEVGSATFEDGDWLDPEGATEIFRKTGVGKWQKIFFNDWVTSRKDKNNKLKQLGVPRDVREHFIGLPIDDHLPFSDASDFQIKERDNKGLYHIALIAPFNAGVNGPPVHEQLRNYYQMIELAKKNALKWIRKQGQDPNDMKLIWEYTKY